MRKPGDVAWVRVQPRGAGDRDAQRSVGRALLLRAASDTVRRRPRDDCFVA